MGNVGGTGRESARVFVGRGYKPRGGTWRPSMAMAAVDLCHAPGSASSPVQRLKRPVDGPGCTVALARPSA